MVAPILTPGIVIGISTLLFWNQLNVPAGLHLSVLGQCSFIIAYVMLLVLARLQSFDPALEEAALDLGAIQPAGDAPDRPAATSTRRSAPPRSIAFFQSVENYNITLFTRGTADTLTVYVGSKIRTGITPTMNALALILILLTVAGCRLVRDLAPPRRAPGQAGDRRARGHGADRRARGRAHRLTFYPAAKKVAIRSIAFCDKSLDHHSTVMHYPSRVPGVPPMTPDLRRFLPNSQAAVSAACFLSWRSRLACRPILGAACQGGERFRANALGLAQPRRRNVDAGVDGNEA